MFVTGSRGEWGYIRPLIALAESRGHKCQVVVTNQHLSKLHGWTVKEVRRDILPVAWIKWFNDDYAINIGHTTEEMSRCIYKHKPDWLILAGDRGEQLAGAIAGAYNYLPTCHIQAGERSGNIDGMARHAISRLVHMHFCANEDAAGRLCRAGEDAWRIHNVGSPQLDDMERGTYRKVKEPYLLCVLHPDTADPDNEGMAGRMWDAVQASGMYSVWLTPNSDPGSELVRRKIPGTAVSNMPRREYLSLLEHAHAIVGNSSSGLLEAPFFGTPCINIGRRQADRICGRNVHHAQTTDEILSAIQAAQRLEPENVYGDGKSTPRILSVLERTKRDITLLQKQMSY